MSSHLEVRENRGFAREIKFLVSQGQAELIRQWARARLEPDPHAGGPTGDMYTITSLYFDTLAFDVYRRNGSYGRAKYRIRRYDDSKRVFLERKLKSRMMVSKRRLIVKVKELPQLECGAADREWPGFWFHRRLLLRGLYPTCQIGYRRTALVTESEAGLVRLTLDQDLRALPARAFRFTETSGVPMIGDRVIVEMKYRREMPPVLCDLVEEFGIEQRPLSKYRLAASALGFVPRPLASSAEEVEYA